MSSTKTNEEHKKSVANTKINKIFIGQLWDHNLCCRRFLQLISITGTEGALRPFTTYDNHPKEGMGRWEGGGSVIKIFYLLNSLFYDL